MDDSKRAGQTIHVDEFGEEYVFDEDGNRQPPMQSRKVSGPGEFTTFDSSQGHCPLCGSLQCRGGCFK